MKLESHFTKKYKKMYEIIWPQKTLIHYFDEAVKKKPHKKAIVDDDRSYTYMQLNAIVNRLAIAFQHFGVAKGDVVTLQMPNQNEVAIIHLALTKVGAIIAPLSLDYNDVEVKQILTETQAAFAIFPDHYEEQNFAEKMLALRPEVPTLKALFVLGEFQHGQLINFKELINQTWETEAGLQQLENIVQDPHDIAEITYKYNKKGKLVGIMHTHNTLCMSNKLLITYLSLTEDENILIALPLSNQIMFNYGLRLAIQLGATSIFQKKWNVHQFLTLIEEEHITFTAHRAQSTADILTTNTVGYDLQSLKYFISIGSLISAEMDEQLYAKFHPKLQTFSSWGNAESSLIALSTNSKKTNNWTENNGYPLPYNEMKIVNNNWVEIHHSKDGKLLIKGPTLFAGYVGNKEKTTSMYWKDWFITDHIAQIDLDGYLHLKS